MVQEEWKRQMHKTQQNMEAAAETRELERQKVVTETDERLRLELQSTAERFADKLEAAQAEARAALAAERQGRALDKEEREAEMDAGRRQRSEEDADAAASAATVGPLDGARAYFDPALPAAAAAAARAALASAGGTECAAWHGGGECTHVIVDPAAALPYLLNARPAAGGRASSQPGVQDLFVVTPQWLTRTAERRQRARCCMLSPDAAAAVASRAISLARGDASGGGGGASTDGEAPRQLGLKRGVEALEAVERSAEESAASAAAAASAEVDRRRKAGRSHRSGTWPKSLAPRCLLEGICWAVTEPPETARWYGDDAGGLGLSKLAVEGVHDSGASSGGGVGGGLPSASASQHTGGDGDSDTAALGFAARDAVVYTLPFITLLLPADRFQEVGLRSLTHHVHERGLTVGELLRVVHAFYAAPLPPWEEAELMLCDSKYASRLRASHAVGERTPRGAVLGSLRTVEGLRRCIPETGNSDMNLHQIPGKSVATPKP